MNNDILYRYFRGEASKEEIHEVRLWASASEENAETLRRERRFFNNLIIAGCDLPDDESLGKPHRPILVRMWKPVAAAIVVVAAMLATWKAMAPAPDTVNVASLQRLTVPYGQTVRLLLADSSQVWVNAASEFSYPTRFDAGRREVNVSGEAFFDVRHDDKVPFVVHAGDMDIKVLGTKFNVKADASRRHFEAALVDGRLRVEVLKPRLGQPFYLRSGDRLSVDSGRVTLSRIGNVDQYRWRDGLYSFTGKTLADICRDLESYYGLTINIDNEKAARRVISGKFRFADGIDYNLSVMATELNFTYTHDYASHVVTIR